MRTTIMIALFTISTLSFGATVNQTIENIEIKKNAKCERVSIGANFCLNFYCLRTDKLTCESNSGFFKVKLKVRTRTLSNGAQDEFVKKIKYIL